MSMTTRSGTTRSAAALGGALVLVLAGCGGDDGGGTIDDAPVGPVDEADDPAGQAEETGGADAGRPYPLFSPVTHPGVALPDPGTATVTVDGFTLTFDTLERCEVGEGSEGRAETFDAAATTVLDDGREARFSVFRSVLVSETQAAGDSLETDSMNVWIQVEPGEPLESNTYLRGDRMEDGGAIQSGADELPFVFVVDDGGSLVATAVGEISLFSSGMPEGAPEGLAEIAVHCG